MMFNSRILVLMCLAVILLAVPSLADTEITGCGIVIYTPDYYFLSSNITETGFNDACVTVAAENLTVDCQGNTIDGANVDTYALEVVYGGNFTLKNCILTNFLVTVDIQGGYDVWIHNNTLGNGLIGLNTVIGTLVELNNFSGFSYAVNDILGDTVKSNFFSSNAYDYQGGQVLPSLIFNNSFPGGVGKILGTVALANDWNVTAQAGKRIVGSGLVGGNYWGLCADDDCNGFCDDSIVIDGNNTDYLPLSTCYMTPSVNVCNLSSSTISDISEKVWLEFLTLGTPPLMKSTAYSCVDNMTLRKDNTFTITGPGGDKSYTKSEQEYCPYGCDQRNNQCIPSTVDRTWMIVAIIAGVLFMIFIARRIS